jgi:hypothetical protein
MTAGDRGSTIPLIIGFFLIALLASAGAVVAGQAFVAQRDLQDECDAMAVAAAAAAADVDRGRAVGAHDALRFADVQRFIDTSLLRDPAARRPTVVARLTDQGRTIRLRCSTTVPVAFGALFAGSHGLRHVVDSSAQAPISP